MKTVQLPEIVGTLVDLMRQAEEEALVLRTIDGKAFVLVEIDEFDDEIEQTRKNQKLMDLLNERAQSQQTVKLSEVKAQLGLD
ncbi:MAG: hypothetical protein F6K19_18140 [Cyanothece sp. SIO1E1]|nr:hypothetical protein [Cyanothece sp. SIO1E1]